MKKKVLSVALIAVVLFSCRFLHDPFRDDFFITADDVKKANMRVYPESDEITIGPIASGGDYYGKCVLYKDIAEDVDIEVISDKSYIKVVTANFTMTDETAEVGYIIQTKNLAANSLYEASLYLNCSVGVSNLFKQIRIKIKFSL
ncbi:MAG TPA: hypothetical protein PK385_09690 [Spirochaetota bacterium]|nr:hypothetical protein [Spirochaetota bacterium]HOS33846.1 hypothetical protein [Spirochaetota bacterium]HOS56317.1 hypothetical protein [Spirochaetota bacterium]HPK61768.1 hypothetical protein [Spirochaetota bacterium]HQF78774.1 hypothetical protein [Spirochaetota bacterium]